MEHISERLARLRGVMAERGLDALIVPRADEYLGEYIPPENERRASVQAFRDWLLIQSAAEDGVGPTENESGS